MVIIKSIIMNILKDPIDYDNLEEELQNALRAEELYNLQNDAKFRAIEQSVPTYEDFRQMVNAAHLKSLDRKDMTPKVGVQWNSVVKDKASSLSHKQRSKTSVDRRSVIQISSNEMPRNTREFQQIWRELCEPKDKFQLLKRTRLALRDQIFRSEIPPEILNDCLDVCLKNLELPENVSSIIDILQSLSECNRFQLAVAFMSEKDKSTCREVFHELRRAIIARNENPSIIDNLEKSYVS